LPTLNHLVPPATRDHVFILWGDRFEELDAAAFLTQLRQAGVRTKLVGLSQQRISGAHGLLLVSDITLEQALTLAHRALAVIIPCGQVGLPRLENDPRIATFLQRAQACGALFMVGPASELEVTRLALFASCGDQLQVYSDPESSLTLAIALAQLFTQSPRRSHDAAP
jgi:hypothetical protein